MEKTKRLNKAINRGTLVGSFGPLELKLIGATTLIPFGMLTIGRGRIPPELGFGLLGGGLMTALTLLANKPYQFLEQVVPRATRIPGIQPLKKGSRFEPQKRKDPKRQRGKPNFRLAENDSDVIATVEYQINAKTIGGYLLRDRKQKLYVRFGWLIEGVDPALSLNGADSYNRGVDDGLQRLPSGVLLAFSLSSRSGDLGVIDELETLKFRATTQIERDLVTSQQQNITDLDQQGLRQTKRLYCFALVPCDVAQNFGTITMLIEQLRDKFTQTRHKQLRKKRVLRRLLANAYDGGWQPVDGILRSDCGYQTRPLTMQELFQLDFNEFHQPDPLLRPPQRLMMTQDDLTVQATQETAHTNYYFFAGQNGLPAAPVERDGFLFYPLTGKYTGFYQIRKPVSYKHEKGFALKQFTWLNDILNKAGLRNYRIYTEFSGAFSMAEAFLIRRDGRYERKKAAHERQLGESGKTAERRAGETEDAELKIDGGDRVLVTGIMLQIYADDPRTLANTFNRVTEALGATATGERCFYNCYGFWKQLQNWSLDTLLATPTNRREKIFSSEASGIIPAVVPRTFDKKGLPFITRNGHAPAHLDIFSEKVHLAIFAGTRSGKGILMTEIIWRCFLLGIPVVGFDFPDPSEGTSTYTPLVTIIDRLGGKAAYYDVSEQSTNVLEMEDLEGHPKAKRLGMMVRDFQEQIITLLVLGSETASEITGDVRNYISQGLVAFHGDETICARYRTAWKGGFGTEDYKQMPTLHDFLAHFQQWQQQYREQHPHEIDARADRALALISRNLRAKLGQAIGKAISQPSSIDPSARLIIYALTNVKDPVDTAIYALSGYNMVLRQTMRHRGSVFLLDELPVLFKAPAIAELTSDLASNGLKASIQLVIAGQNADAILNAPQGKQILSTIQRILSGSIEEVAIPGLAEIGFPRQLLELYLQKDRKVDRSTLMSSWILKVGTQASELLYRPPILSLGIGANNKAETDARDRVLDRYPDDPVAGVHDFSQQLANAMMHSKDLHELHEAIANIR